jgi:hypothetical protein
MASIRKRTSKDGVVLYRVDIRLKGYPAQRATFKRLTDARKWAQAIESAIREGRYFRTAEARKHTLGEAIDRYVDTVLPAKKPVTVRPQRQHLEWWRQELGGWYWRTLPRPG